MRQIEKKDIVDIVDYNYQQYAISVITDRSIPTIDGMKPSHRQLIWSMYNMHLQNKRTKSTNVVGNNMKFNPHGDMAIYSTLIRLAQPDTMIIPLIDGKGNLGDRCSSEICEASSRYTEVGMAQICKYLLQGIEENAVPMIPNYDEKLLEPKYLPTVYPNILVSPNKGIAVGMTSNFASHNLSEVCDLTIAYLRDKNINVSDYLIAPDFPTGGHIIYSKSKMEEIYNTGKGSVKIRANYEYDKQSNTIIINQLPFNSKRESIINRISELVSNNKIKGINRIIDATDLNGLSLVIDLKTGTDPHILMERLYQLTKLEDSFNYNMNLLCLDGTPRVLNVKQILDEWITFRHNCLLNTVKFRYDKFTTEKLELTALISTDAKLLSQIILDSEENDMINNIKKQLNVDDYIAKYLSSLSLSKKNKTNLKKSKKRLDVVNQQLDICNLLIENTDMVTELMIKELTKIKNEFGKDRVSQILPIHSIAQNSVVDIAIDDYNCIIYTTKDGYIKKVKSIANKGNQKLKDDDYILNSFNVKNSGTLLVFTKQGNCYRKKISDMDEHKLSQLGEYVKSSITNNEDILLTIATNDFTENIIALFDNGKLVKFPLQKFNTKSNRSVVKNAININNNVKFIDIQTTTEQDVSLLIQTQSKLGLFNTIDFMIKQSTTTMGSTIIKLKDDILNVYKVNNTDKEIYTEFEDFESNKNTQGKAFKPMYQELLNKHFHNK